LEWHLLLLILFGSLLFLMLTGLPVAFCFIIINVIGAVVFWGGEQGLNQVSRSIVASITTFSFMPIPLFVLMGEFLFRSGIGSNIIDVVDRWLGRVPGRLALVSVGAGTILSTLSGSQLGSTALLGSLLVPEMEARKYQKIMSLGPIMGGACLASIIPPSILAIVLGGLGYMSIGELLIAGIIPGLIMSVFFAAYIVIRCKLQPSLAPSYQSDRVIPFSEKIRDTLIYIFPLGFILFLVTGSILVGFASPSEAAALGALGSIILVAISKKLSLKILKQSLMGTLRVTAMVLMIVTGSSIYSALLSFSGATRALSSFVVGLDLPPIALIIMMQIVIVFMGCFIDAISIFMITVPIFLPIVKFLGYDTVWFGILVLINVTFGTMTPPFGLTLFIAKGVSSPDTRMEEIFRASVPFLLMAFLVMILILIFPGLAIWLPGVFK
jgi:tripartite ATP-independent transporter DctM subunit